MEFIENNSIALISLLVALIGGVPGVIAAINHFKNKIIFDFKVEGFIVGNSNRGKFPFVFLVGTVTNAGNKPLVPNTYDLEIKMSKKWIKLKKMAIPANSTFGNDVQVMNIPDAHEKDLLRIKQNVTTSSPAYGCLMFTTDEISLGELKDNEYTLRLTCFDVFSKKHEMELPKPKGKFDQSVVLPKHDISILPK